MQRSNFEKKELRQHQKRCGHNWTSLKQKRKNQSVFVILKKESNEDVTIFEGERSTHHIDMMSHVIHILHTFFIFLSWNYLFFECVDDISPSSLWSSNSCGTHVRLPKVVVQDSWILWIKNSEVLTSLLLTNHSISLWKIL
jgi:hypothetical protein